MIEDYEAQGDDANEFMPYGLTFKHKHLPELQTYAKLTHDAAVPPAVGNFRAGHDHVRAAAALDARQGPDRRRAPRRHRRSFRRDPGQLRRRRAAEPTRAQRPSSTRRSTTTPTACGCTSSPTTPGPRRVLVAVYDNLGKGASGAAVQNLNLMLGVEADTSWRRRPRPQPVIPLAAVPEARAHSRGLASSPAGDRGGGGRALAAKRPPYVRLDSRPPLRHYTAQPKEGVCHG